MRATSGIRKYIWTHRCWTGRFWIQAGPIIALGFMRGKLDRVWILGKWVMR